jgi:hypothetical protein
MILIDSLITILPVAAAPTRSKQPAAAIERSESAFRCRALPIPFYSGVP